MRRFSRAAIGGMLIIGATACAPSFQVHTVQSPDESVIGLRTFRVLPVPPPRKSAFDCDWPGFVARLNLTGIAGMVARHSPGSPGESVSSRVAPLGEVTVTGATVSDMVWRMTSRVMPRVFTPRSST